MQTFLPYQDFDKTASVLDSRRLNKQILECYQILKVLNNPDPKAGWRNHPAVKMWRGHENALFDYTLAMIREADRRGIKTDKNKENLMVLRVACWCAIESEKIVQDQQCIRSHRSRPCPGTWTACSAAARRSSRRTTYQLLPPQTRWTRAHCCCLYRQLRYYCYYYL